MVHIKALGAPTHIGFKHDFQQQVSRCRAADSRTASAGQPDKLTFVYALGNTDLQLMVNVFQPAGRIQLGAAQRQGAAGTQKRVLDVKFNLRVVVIAAHAAAGKFRAPPLRSVRTRRAAKELFKEIAVFSAIVDGVRELKAGVPIRWRSEVLRSTRLRVHPQSVIRAALLWVGQHRVGLVELDHALHGIAFLADIRMVFSCQLPIGLFDVVSRGRFVNAKYLVIVLELHA